MQAFDVTRCIGLVEKAMPFRVYGRVTDVVGLLVEVGGITPSVGEICLLRPVGSERAVQLEVVGFRSGRALMMPLGGMEGIGPGSRVEQTGERAATGLGDAIVGRVVDGLGEPIDGLGKIAVTGRSSIYGRPINPLERSRIREPLDIGIRSINGLITIGKGQRVGIMAGSGVGKSVLMGMLARYTRADVNVIALIGERGREVREFIENELGEEGLKKSVVVAATSDQPALVRLRAASLATTYAEFFRDKGMDVLLMMDSATRVAMAQREVGLAVGEPPTTKGYPPSAFALLPRLLERSGTAARGSITGLYTVLVEADDMNDPVADTMRSILDGHIVLSRELASRGHYPAVDILQSTSRVMVDITDERHRAAAKKFVEVLADYRSSEDLINIGAYKSGSSASIDRSIRLRGPMSDFLAQGLREKVSFQESVRDLFKLFDGEGGYGDVKSGSGPKVQT